jgi:hypothetical protein
LLPEKEDSTVPKKKLNDGGLAEKVTHYLRAKQAGSRGYQRADRLMKEIAKLVQPGEEVPFGDGGRKIVLVDKFASAKDDIIWTPCAARRWELKVIEP